LVNSAETILIAAITGFVGAAISYIYNNKKAEQDSRRSYEYEARKRLYTECEPILFQIIELSNNAFKLIKWLANETKKGKFVSSQENRLFIGNTYMMKSTIYRFLAPLAAFRILQSALTTVDLRLDSKINLQYMLMKKLYESFTRDDDLAESDIKLIYKPLFDKKWADQRKKEPQKFRKQGFNFGRLEKLTSELIIRDSNGIRRVMTYGEFESEFEHGKNADDDNDETDKKFRIPYLIFYDFHPNRLPVLWRILMTQAQIYDIIISISKLPENKIASLDQHTIKKISQFDLRSLDWRDLNADEEPFDKNPFEAVEEYLQKELDDIYHIIPLHNNRISNFKLK